MKNLLRCLCTVYLLLLTIRCSGTLIINDTFTDGDSVNSISSGVHHADTGQTYTFSNSDWGITTNRAYDTSNPNDGVVGIDVPGMSDGIVQITFVNGSSQAYGRLILRASDTDHYILIQSEPAASQYAIYECNTHVFNLIGNLTGSGVPSDGDVVTVTAIGTHLHCAVGPNSTDIVTSYNLASTGWGFGQGASHTTSIFDNFSLNTVPTSTPTATATQTATNTATATNTNTQTVTQTPTVTPTFTPCIRKVWTNKTLLFHDAVVTSALGTITVVTDPIFVQSPNNYQVVTFPVDGGNTAVLRAVPNRSDGSMVITVYDKSGNPVDCSTTYQPVSWAIFRKD